MVVADGQRVSVSSPDRVIYPATDATPGGHQAPGGRVLPSASPTASCARSATGRRPWSAGPTGVHAGITLATGRGDKSDAFYSKRVPKGAPVVVETTECSSRAGARRRRSASEPGHRRLVRADGHDPFHPWPTRSGDNDHPDELRIDLDPQPGTDVHRRGPGGRRRARAARGVRHHRLSQDQRQPRRAHLRPHRAPVGVHRRTPRGDRLRPRAREARPRVTTKWWKEERGERIFVDFNQNSRDRTIASAYSLRPARRPGRRPRCAGGARRPDRPPRLQPVQRPRALADPDPWAGIDDTQHSIEPLLRLYEESPEGEAPFPPDYPKMPGEPPRVQPSKKVASHWDENGERTED